MSNPLKELIDMAEASNTSLELNVFPTGITATVTAERNAESALITKKTSLWIDRNETDMMVRLEHFIQLVK